MTVKPYRADGGDISTDRIKEIANNPYGDEEKCWLAKRVLALQDELEKAQAQSSKWYEAFHKAVSVGARYEERIAELTESLKQTVSGYKTCLRTGYERILDLDGDCDTPEVMIAGSSEIQQAEKLLAAAAAKGE